MGNKDEEIGQPQETLVPTGRGVKFYLWWGFIDELSKADQVVVRAVAERLFHLKRRKD